MPPALHATRSTPAAVAGQHWVAVTTAVTQRQATIQLTRLPVDAAAKATQLGAS